MSAFISAPFDSQPLCRYLLDAPPNSGLFLAVKEGSLLAMPIPSGSPEGIAKTFGMQLLEADFSSVNFEGFYTLSVEFETSNGMHAFRTAPFEIRSRLVTSRMMKPLSILNAEVRRAADEELLAQLDQRVRGLERGARRRISGRSR